MSCQHSPGDQTLRLQAGAGEDVFIHLPSSPIKSQEEEEEEEGGGGGRREEEEEEKEEEGEEEEALCLCGKNHSSIHSDFSLKDAHIRDRGSFVEYLCTERRYPWSRPNTPMTPEPL